MLWLDKIVVQIHGQKKLQSCPQHIDILSGFLFKKTSKSIPQSTIEFDMHNRLKLKK